LQHVNNTGPEALPVSVFSTLHKSRHKIQPTEHIKLNQTVTNWNRKCFWTSVVYILWNGLMDNLSYFYLTFENVYHGRGLFNLSVLRKRKMHIL